MKKSLISLLTLSFALSGAALLQTGCASSSTSQSTGEYIDDSAITAKVKAALMKDDSVRARDVSVETYKATVQLGGFVNNADQKSQAELLAIGVPGVRDVKNNIQIK